MDAADAAYRAAQRDWRSSARGWSADPSRRKIIDRELLDFVVVELEEIRHAAAFATDVAEMAWLRQALRDDRAHLDQADAERVVAIVFGWVIGYEEALSTWVGDRRQRAYESVRRTRTGDGPAFIADVAAVSRLSDGWVAEFVIGDVPEPEGFEHWHQQVGLALGARWHLRRDGIARISVSSLEALPAEVGRLRDALAQVEAEIHDFAAEQAGRREGRERIRGAAEDELGALEGSWPTWVARVRAQGPAVLGEPLDRVWWQVSLEAGIGASIAELLAQAVVAAGGAVEQQGSWGLVVSGLDAPALLEALEGAAADVEPYRTALQATRDAEAAESSRMLLELRSMVGRRGRE